MHAAAPATTCVTRGPPMSATCMCLIVTIGQVALAALGGNSGTGAHANATIHCPFNSLLSPSTSSCQIQATARSCNLNACDPLTTVTQTGGQYSCKVGDTTNTIQLGATDATAFQNTAPFAYWPPSTACYDTTRNPQFPNKNPEYQWPDCADVTYDEGRKAHFPVATCPVHMSTLQQVDVDIEVDGCLYDISAPTQTYRWFAFWLVRAPWNDVDLVEHGSDKQGGAAEIDLMETLPGGGATSPAHNFNQCGGKHSPADCVDKVWEEDTYKAREGGSFRVHITMWVDPLSGETSDEWPASLPVYVSHCSEAQGFYQSGLSCPPPQKDVAWQYAKNWVTMVEQPDQQSGQHEQRVGLSGNDGGWEFILDIWEPANTADSGNCRIAVSNLKIQGGAQKGPTLPQALLPTTMSGWTRYENRNCFDGRGATALYGDDWKRLTLAQCLAWCTSYSASDGPCEGVTVGKTGAAWLGRTQEGVVYCWPRKALTIDLCPQDTRQYDVSGFPLTEWSYDTWIKDQAISMV